MKPLLSQILAVLLAVSIPVGVPLARTIPLLLVVGGFAIRWTVRRRPVPRRRRAESLPEGHLILLGTFRLYTWLLTARALFEGVLILASSATAIPLPWAFIWASLALLHLLVARSLYWRLGYDRRRYGLLAAHLSLSFALTEYACAIHSDMHTYLVWRTGSSGPDTPR